MVFIFLVALPIFRIGQYLGGGGVNIGAAVAAGIVELFNNNMQSDDASVLVNFDPGLGFEVQLVQFVAFDLLLHGLADEVVDQLVLFEYVFDEQAVLLPQGGEGGRHAVREVAAGEGQGGGFVEIQEDFVALAHVTFVHAQSLQQLELQLLEGVDSCQEGLACLLALLQQPAVGLAQIVAFGVDGAGASGFGLCDAEFEDIEQIFGVVLDDGGFVFQGREQTDAAHFVHHFAAHLLGTAFLLFPDVVLSDPSTFCPSPTVPVSLLSPELEQSQEVGRRGSSGELFHFFQFLPALVVRQIGDVVGGEVLELETTRLVCKIDDPVVDSEEFQDEGSKILPNFAGLLRGHDLGDVVAHFFVHVLGGGRGTSSHCISAYSRRQCGCSRGEGGVGSLTSACSSSQLRERERVGVGREWRQLVRWAWMAWAVRGWALVWAWSMMLRRKSREVCWARESALGPSPISCLREASCYCPIIRVILEYAFSILSPPRSIKHNPFNHLIPSTNPKNQPIYLGGGMYLLAHEFECCLPVNIAVVATFISCMNLELFLQEERWMPSFGLIGPTEIIFHMPTNSSAIKTFSFNDATPKPSLKLCEDMANHVRNLALELREGKVHPLQSRVHNLRQMLTSIKEDADRTGISDYNKTLYKVVQLLGWLSTNEAVKQGVQLREPVYLRECLSHLMALDEKRHFKQEEDEAMDMLKSMLQKGDYLKLLNHLKEKYIRIQEKIDPHNQQRLELLLSAIYARANQDGFYIHELPSHRVAQLWENVYAEYRTRFAALRSRLPVVAGRQAEAAAIEEMIGVVLGEPAAIAKMSRDSWHMYLLHRLSAYPNEMAKSRQMAEEFMKTKGGLTREDEMVVGILGGESVHSTYQRLLELVHPYFAHLLGLLLLDSGQGVTAALLLDQQYKDNILRGLLEEASMLGWSCFLRMWSCLVIQEGSAWRHDLVEPLLYHHLQLLPGEFLAQASVIAKKADDLYKFGLQGTVLPQLISVFNQLRTSQLSLPLLKVAVLCSISNPTGDTILPQLLSHIDMVFTNSHQSNYRFCLDAVKWERELKVHLRKRNNKRKYHCLLKILPALEKYQLLRVALGEGRPEMGERCRAAAKLLKMWRRSLELLIMCRTLLNLLNTPEKVETVDWQREEMQEFAQATAHFIHNYPGEHTEVEMAELTRIFPYFY